MNHIMNSAWKNIFLPAIAFSFLFLLASTEKGYAQDFDLLIRNGHVIDIKNNIDGIFDVAVKDGKIALVEHNIAESRSRKIIDATNCYVTPGLIDIHTHVFVGDKANTFADGINSVSPDDFTLKAGITTVVDAGTSGWRNFEKFKRQVIDQSKTRILVLLNIFGSGLIGSPEEQDTMNINEQMTTDFINKYPDVIVGTVIGHYSGQSWMPFDAARRVARNTGRTMMVECHLPGLTLSDQLDHMDDGDIIAHAFEDIAERMPVVDKSGKVHSFVLKARDRGILFDVSHGGAGFWFRQAIPAFNQGLLPTSFGTDLHRFSINAGMKDMLNVMSKYLNMGMNLKDVFRIATWSSANSVKRPDLGNLSVGSIADIAVITVQKGSFGFIDAGGEKIEGEKKLQAELTIREGKIVWDLNGMSARKYLSK